MAVNEWLKTTRRVMDSPLGALAGGSVYGAWALWINWSADASKAVQAAGMHTLLSAAITLGSVALMRRLFALARGPRQGFLVAAGGSLTITYAILVGFHVLLGTPHVLLTLLPGMGPTVGFDTFYSYLLAREAGHRFNFRSTTHVLA